MIIYLILLNRERTYVVKILGFSIMNKSYLKSIRVEVTYLNRWRESNANRDVRKTMF